MTDDGSRARRDFEAIKRQFQEYDRLKREGDRIANAAAQCAAAMLEQILAEHGKPKGQR